VIEPASSSSRQRQRQMGKMAASARTKVDWRYYVKTYPWVCLGAAAALGFLIVPKRSRATRPDLVPMTEPATTGHLVVKPAPAATHGLIDALLATVANIAMCKATVYLGQCAGRLLGITGHRETSRHEETLAIDCFQRGPNDLKPDRVHDPAGHR
jgi:hypothetical protein